MLTFPPDSSLVVDKHSKLLAARIRSVGLVRVCQRLLSLITVVGLLLSYANACICVTLPVALSGQQFRPLALTESPNPPRRSNTTQL